MTADRVIGVGVLGATSWIYTAALARAFAAVDGVEVVHEASRGAVPVDADPATRRPRISADYGAVLEDPAVHLVYNPLPNHLHEEWTLAAAAAGKHVLCEKPLAIDATAAARIADGCDRAGVHVLEAYMSPFHPRTAALQAFVADGGIGPVHHGEARMCGVMAEDNHRWRVEAGGGALLDVGIYCLEPILTAMGWDGAPPERISASSRLGGDGVDTDTSAWIRLADGRTAHVFVSFAAADQQHLRLSGSTGTLEVDVRHATPDRRDSGFAVRRLDGSVEAVPTGTGDCYEGLVAHARDVLRGVAEPLRPPSRSIAIARVIDAIAVAAGHPRVTERG